MVIHNLHLLAFPSIFLYQSAHSRQNPFCHHHHHLKTLLPIQFTEDALVSLLLSDWFLLFLAETMPKICKEKLQVLSNYCS